MGTTAQKLNRVLQTKSDLKTVINYSGANITNETTFKDYPKLLNKAYIDILNDEGDSLYNALPKTTATGSNLTLNTEKGKMKITFKGDTQQEGTPTPSNPQNVEVVTGEQNIQIVGKNLFDKDNINILNGYLWSNEMVLKDSFADRIFYLPCQPNTTYTISRSVLTTSFRVATYNNIIPTVTSERVVYTCYNEINNDNGETITITTQSDSKYLLVLYANTTNDDNIEESLATIQIEKGSTPTTYEPYQSQKYPINLGKNLFDKHNANYFNAYISVGSRKLMTGNDDRTIYIKCKPNTTYTIQKMVQETTDKNRFVVGTTSSIPQINDVMNDFHYYSGGTTNTILTLTTGSTANYLCVFCWSIDSVTTFEEMLDSIQIEVGSQATEYSPYFEPIELCKIRDNQDYIYENDGNWFLHKKIGKVILNGGSNESYAYQNNHRFFLRRSYWTNDTTPFNPPQNALQGLYCNRFKEVTRGNTWNGIEGISYDNPNTTEQPIGSTFDIACNSVATNENDFKTWLSSNNLIVYYILQNINIIHISETDYPTLYQQLEDIYNNVKSYDGVTHIMQTNDDLPFNLEVSALAKIE